MDIDRCRKKRKGGFTSGNQEFIKRSKTDKEVADCNRYLERTRNQKKALAINDVDNEYFISKKKKMETLWNTGFKEHSEVSSQCKGKFKLNKTHHSILSTAWSLYCEICEWHSSQPVKMFDEYYRNSVRSLCGSKNSTLNDALAFGLLTSPIGASVFHELFLTIGIDPGSRSGLSKLISQCGLTMLDIGESVLEETKEYLKQTFTTDIDVTMDTRYNNPIFSAHTPFQGGTQATTTVIEEVSGQRKIIDVITSSKLCTKGRRLRKTDKTIQCPGHIDCTANLKSHEAIGNEANYAEQAAQSLKLANFNLRHVALDGDCKQKKGIQVVFEGVVFQIDSRHFANAQNKKIKTYELSDAMLKSDTKKQKDKYKGYFAKEIMMRCTAEFNAVHKQCKKCATSSLQMKDQMNALFMNLKKAILDCYQGKHAKCKKYSFVCHPPSKCWSKKALPKPLKDRMTMTPGDRKQILEFIDLRLGDTAVDQTYLNMNTQKVEAVNRLYLKTNPKCVTSVRNFRPRILSAVIQSNLGFDNACFRLQKTANHQVCGTIKKKIIAHGRNTLLLQQSKRTFSSKHTRIQKRADLIQLHEESQGRGDDYQKGIDIGEPSCSS